MNETIEFETSYEELEFFHNDDLVGIMYLRSTGGKRFSEDLQYPPHLMPANGRYLGASHTVSLSVSDEAFSISPSVRSDVSIQQFVGRIFGFAFDAPAFKLYTLTTDDLVAQIQLDPAHLPKWLSDEGDVCYMSIRVEYDHEAMLDHYSEDEIEAKRKQFPEKVADMEELRL
ncbi:hypothetical protein C488_06123 [Natrinema pellirubrum DSM 15624]|uniref:Uncharacterized protein n=1 Tax=Natrinema pellirubrum (strain DSM 15624 / CIP 106293 / JCM 10476 / NCIMB 786 / 157) TaxID=797303 RepID=L0JMC1_NATP1|nr:hypothetical protein [Natrinema pellirubrum]AGB31983.1 hypothetical protein Natpe_2155 [Natrinema pellirubrum DSM 15624]ELY78152.1 hypothetical protein C488_06123 [Natrinema pellirubrum DSM 15624]